MGQVIQFPRQKKERIKLSFCDCYLSVFNEWYCKNYLLIQECLVCEKYIYSPMVDWNKWEGLLLGKDK